MEAKAIGRYLRVTPRKARYVLDEVRGKSASEALAMLKFIPNEAARYIERIIESAVANAEHNYAMDREILRICRAYVDKGPTIKRIQPRAMGRAYRILKRMSHITVVVAEDESLRKIIERPAKGKGERVKGVRAAESSAPKVEKQAASSTTAKKKSPAPKRTAKTRSTKKAKEEQQ